MNLLHKPSKILITGASGTGKTTLFCELLSASKADFKFVFDHEGELSLRLNRSPCLTIDQISKAARTGWVIFDPSELFPGCLLQAWDFFCELVFRLSRKLRGTKLLAVDELQKLVSNHAGGIKPSFAKVLETGRRYSLDVLAVAQQPNLLHNRIRAQLTQIICFNLPDATASAWVTDAGLPDPRNLKAGEYYAKNLRTGRLIQDRVF